MKLVLIILGTIVATAVFAQEPTPTSIHGHNIGESVEQFLTRAGYDLSICQQKKQGGMNLVCRDLAKGNEPCVKENCYGGKDGFRYTLKDHKLFSVEYVSTDGFATIVTSLTEKYGKPLETHIEVVENGFGARYQVGRATWVMPDGVEIAANESVNFVASLGIFRITTVEFAPKLTPIVKANPF